MPKAEAQNLNFSSKALVPTTANLAFYLQFFKQFANWSALIAWHFHRSCSCQDDCGIYYTCAALA